MMKVTCKLFACDKPILITIKTHKDAMNGLFIKRSISI